MRKKILFVSIFVVLLSGSYLVYNAYEYAKSSKQIQAHGYIRVLGVEIWKDEALTEILGFIDWGILSAGEETTYFVWVENQGNSEIKLSMWTEAWNPTNASDWIDLSWDYDDSWIPANSSIPILFTLSVSSNIIGITNFSFDIWVKGVY